MVPLVMTILLLQLHLTNHSSLIYRSTRPRDFPILLSPTDNRIPAAPPAELPMLTKQSTQHVPNDETQRLEQNDLNDSSSLGQANKIQSNRRVQDRISDEPSAVPTFLVRVIYVLDEMDVFKQPDMPSQLPSIASQAPTEIARMHGAENASNPSTTTTSSSSLQSQAPRDGQITVPSSSATSTTTTTSTFLPSVTRVEAQHNFENGRTSVVSDVIVVFFNVFFFLTIKASQLTFPIFIHYSRFLFSGGYFEYQSVHPTK